MKKKSILLSLLIASFFANFCFSQVFDISDATTVDNTSGSNPKTVSETVSGITMTVRIQRINTSNPDLTQHIDTANLGGVFGTTNGAVFQASSSETGMMTIQFDTNVDISNLRMGSTENGQARTWTFTPIGGTNSVVTETSSFIGDMSSISLNWTSITGIEITSNATGLEQFVLDSATLGASVNNVPSVVSFGATPISSSGATLNGEVTSNGGATIIERGFVYALTSTDATPTVAESGTSDVTKVIVSGTLGVFQQAISSLVASSEYSYAAYAINNEGSNESIVQNFTTISNSDDCIDINAYDATSDFTNNLNLGQSFIACQTGTIKSIGVLVANGETSVNETINVYSGSTIAAGNLLGTVSGQEFTSNGGDSSNLDITDFLSQNISVIAGQTYTFDIPTTAYLVYTGDNGYANGTVFLDGTENVGNFDLIFQVEIEAETLQTIDYIQNDISIYPNPIKNQFYISSNNSLSGEATLYNIIGKTVKKFKLDDNVIDVSNISNGVYLLKLKTNQGTLVKRIVKE